MAKQSEFGTPKKATGWRKPPVECAEEGNETGEMQIEGVQSE